MEEITRGLRSQAGIVRRSIQVLQDGSISDYVFHLTSIGIQELSGGGGCRQRQEARPERTRGHPGMTAPVLKTGDDQWSFCTDKGGTDPSHCFFKHLGLVS